ncbi:MAG: hypothetical protein Q7V88_13575 [Actinomycetota bacterium]|nr:hypothetical protein [Actinomycetota bacterium]
MPRPELTDDDRTRLSGWFEPSTAEVLLVRSRILAALAAQSVTPRELRMSLGVDRRMQVSLGSFSKDRTLVGDVVTENHADVIAVRAAYAFDEALEQLSSDRVIERTPNRATVTLVGTWLGNSSSGGITERIPQLAPQHAEAPLRLVSSGRSWTTTDHEAFDPAAYLVPPRSTLVTADGELLIAETIEAHRMGRYLSATITLFVFAETAWWEAARRVASTSPATAALVANPLTAISKVQEHVLKFLDDNKQKHRSANLRSWADSTRQIRNFGAHGSILAATSGSFTEAASAAWIISCYQHLAEIELGLAAAGV